MRAIVLLFYVLLIYSRADSQKLVKKIDSLINSIENSNTLTMISRCDTAITSHSDYTIALCDEYYSYNNKIFKIIRKVDNIGFSGFYDKLYGLAPEEIGTTSLEVFYFNNDSLIKVFTTNYSNNSAAIYSHYFTQDEIKRLKWAWEREKEKYYVTKNWFDQAEELLNDFKQGKIK